MNSRNPFQFIKSFSEFQVLNSKCSSSVFYPKDLANLKSLLSAFLEYDSNYLVQFWMKIETKPLRLECLWELQRLNYIEFTTYFYHNPDLIPSLSGSFDQLIWSEEESVKQYCAEVIGGLLAVLVNLGAQTQRDIYVLGRTLLTSIIEKFVEKLLGARNYLPEPVPFLTELNQHSSCASSRLQVFNSTILQAIVQYTPEAVTLEEAIGQQAILYTTSKTNPTLNQVFKEVLSNMTEECITGDLTRYVTSKEPFNWRWLLTIVSIFVQRSIRSAGVLKELIESWISQGCANKDSTLLATGILCARQACAENTDYFGSYSSWFGNLKVRPASAFMFLFNFLSEIVPHEPVLPLKIHVNKIPSAPPSCHAAIADYAALAKTRLADLNQTTDYLGLFGEYTTTEQEGREEDVMKVVNHFRQTKEVMKIVLEASVFRRQYYEKVFLVELLKGHNSGHKEFIEKLYSIGKIPHGLYNKWKCKYDTV